MKPNEYQKLAMRTAPEGMSKDDYILNAALGMSGESGEFADIVKKHIFQGHDSAEDHLKKELGDVLWYVAMACEGLGTSIETIMEMNIDKLKARYPDGFDSDRSINKEKYHVDDEHLDSNGKKSGRYPWGSDKKSERTWSDVIDHFYFMYPRMKDKIEDIRPYAQNQIIAYLKDGTQVIFNDLDQSLTILNHTDVG